MKLWICSFFLIVLSCNSPDSLRSFCPLKCYTGPANTSGRGVCHVGVPTCDEEFNILSCEGEIVPSSEVCDGLDNDCDGSIDTDTFGILKRYPSFSNYPCFSMGACAYSSARCENGEWVCHYGSRVELPKEKTCDGIDNDCDGIVDEDLYDNLPLSDRICYDGNPVQTLATPPCRAGLLECIKGQTICLNEVVPTIELCDNVDNDCNGVIDDAGDILSAEYDIVFIVDTSGSMCEEIDAVAGATSAYVQQFENNTNFKFALIIMSEMQAPYVVVHTDFSDFATIHNTLLMLGCWGGGYEASLDSMFLTCDSSNPLKLSWRESANALFFMFTDEFQQTYMSPPVSGQQIIDECLFTNTLPFIWAWNVPDFQYIAQGAGGEYFTLSADWHKIFDDMNSIIIKLCK